MLVRRSDLSARSPSPIAAPTSRASVDPAALVALFAVPCVIAATLALLPERNTNDEVYRDGFRPTIERPTLAAVPSVRSAPVASPRPTHVTPVAVATSSARGVAAPAATSVPINRVATVNGVSATQPTPIVSEEGWGWDEAAWQSWWARNRAYYEAWWARRRWARAAPAMARMYRVRAAMMDALQSAGAFDPSMFDAMSDCGPFACGATSSAYVPPPSSASASRATVRRDGARWNIGNAHTELSVRPSQQCELRYTIADGAARSIVFDTPSSSDDDTPATTTACEVREITVRDGAALELSWRTSRWTQRAIVTLGHNATQAEATIARDVRSNDATGAHTIELVNLSSTAREWTIGGRALSLEPGGVLRVRASADEE
ncbi:MAG: hypothetical protein JNK05_08775 [Myxococcales bacterium]|nr:hypothetical protein [Myxococcales bacterium]